MQKSADIIGIGAINYDYMFRCSKNPDSLVETDPETEPSAEELNWSLEKTEQSIQQFYESPFTTCSTQIGGSALLALRAIKAVCPSMSFGYVGVCGEYNRFDHLYKQELKNLEEELSFLDNQEWLFRTTEMDDCPEKYIGKSSCTIYQGNRNGIGIFPGANNLLLTFIEEKCKSEPLSDYLAQARWIHISSLSDINMWTQIMEHVLQAKEKNRSLKISIDPGSEFTKVHKEKIRKYLQAADYLFLNPSEKEYLGAPQCREDETPEVMQLMKKNSPCDLPINKYENPTDRQFRDENETLQNIRNYLGYHPVTLVFKYKDRHVLADAVKGTPCTYDHPVIPPAELVNDTGAGDFFAGGFIGGLLSDTFPDDPSSAIETGNILSTSRIVTDSIHDAISIAVNHLKKYTIDK